MPHVVLRHLRNLEIHRIWETPYDVAALQSLALELAKIADLSSLTVRVPTKASWVCHWASNLVHSANGAVKFLLLECVETPRATRLWSRNHDECSHIGHHVFLGSQEAFLPRRVQILRRQKNGS